MTNLPIALQVWKENHLLARAIQGEGSSRTLTVTFLGADGAPISLEGCTPRLYLTGTNPPVFTDGTVKDSSGGTAEFLLPSGLTETHGVYACQFLLSGTNYPPLKADGLTLLVEASDLESAAMATEEFSSLTVALGKADAAGKEAVQAATEAKVSAETASAAEAVAASCKTQAVSSAEAAAADRGKADTSAAAAVSARDAAQTSAAAAAQSAEALANVYTKTQTDVAFLPQSARGAAGGVMGLPTTLPPTGSLLSMGAGGSVNGAFIPFCCVLSPTASGWTLLDNSGHTPLNVQSVEVSADGASLILHHAAGATKVYSFQISPDEQFAKYGITAGASVGVDYSIINLYPHCSIRICAIYRWYLGALCGVVAPAFLRCLGFRQKRPRLQF